MPILTIAIFRRDDSLQGCIHLTPIRVLKIIAGTIDSAVDGGGRCALYLRLASVGQLRSLGSLEVRKSETTLIHTQFIPLKKIHESTKLKNQPSAICGQSCRAKNY
jgi:hypothetical protein